MGAPDPAVDSQLRCGHVFIKAQLHLQLTRPWLTYQINMQLTDADVEAVKQEIVDELVEKLEQVRRVPQVLLADIRSKAGFYQ